MGKFSIDDMVQRELIRLHFAAGGFVASKFPLVSSRDFEKKGKIVAFDGEVSQVPVPVGKCVDHGLEGRCCFFWGYWFVVDDERGRVE